MSTKNEFSSSGGIFAALSALVTVAILFACGSPAVSQPPPEASPLTGGFKIDFGDAVDGVPSGAFPAESIRSAAVSATKKPAETSPQPSATNPIQQTDMPQNSIPGLPQTALPMAFPAAASQTSPAKGPATLINAGDMIGFSRELGDGVQAITIINSSRRWMAVYHIDTSGQIRLASSRPLDADFTIQFNATAPLPEDIRRLQGK
jgi:hypothetical protein